MGRSSREGRSSGLAGFFTVRREASKRKKGEDPGFSPLYHSLTSTEAPSTSCSGDALCRADKGPGVRAGTLRAPIPRRQGGNRLLAPSALGPVMQHIGQTA